MIIDSDYEDSRDSVSGVVYAWLNVECHTLSVVVTSQLVSGNRRWSKEIQFESLANCTRMRGC